MNCGSTTQVFSIRLNERGKPGARSVDTEPRKLLVHRKQIDFLTARKKTGLTVVPTKLLTQGRYIKIVIALAKGKKLYDKRETIKRRDIDREHKSVRYVCAPSSAGTIVI